MNESTTITVSFVALLVGLAVILAGVWLDGELALVVAGAIVMVLSVGGFVLATPEEDPGGRHGPHH